MEVLVNQLADYIDLKFVKDLRFKPWIYPRDCVVLVTSGMKN